jgi:hypothetical protein
LADTSGAAVAWRALSDSFSKPCPKSDVSVVRSRHDSGMHILVRQSDGEELAHIADAEYVPRAGDEIVLCSSHAHLRKRWQVARVVVSTDRDDSWPKKYRNPQVVKSIVVEVEPVQ